MTKTMSGVSGPRAASLLVEGVVIVISILLAFAIEAWWDGVQERGLLDDQRNALQTQVEANLERLTQDSVAVARGWAAEQELVNLISPSPRALSVDSLTTLFRHSFSGNVQPLEVSALEAILSGGSLASTDPDLQRLLIGFRTTLTRTEESQALRLGLREDLISYLTDVGSTSFISSSTGAHAPTDFEVPVTEILSDRKLEGLVGNIAVRSQVVVGNVETLRSTADSILARLATRN